MSRAGYSDDCDDDWGWIRYRGSVTSAIRGKRGQAFLRELLAALDALPEPRLIQGNLMTECGVCALGAVGLARGLDLLTCDPYDHEAIAQTFGIASALTREIAYENDEGVACDTPEQRFACVREWVVSRIRAEAA